MLYWALVFFVVSIVAAVFGFTGIAVVTAEIAKILFFIFIVLFIIFLITGILRRPPRGLWRANRLKADVRLAKLLFDGSQWLLGRERRCKMKQKRLSWAVAVLVVLIPTLLACQTPAGRTAGEVVDDATITTAVKAKLFDDSVVRGFAISVKTFEGEVTLTGGVDTQEQKDRAGEIAQSVTGVRKVNNLIKIK
jgi:hyperosmotically inducible periplasmic protein